ncbi:phenylalanine--tRNA ligase subunit alpha [Candidatus Woesearchaeota archaeon]|nr:phenylalanine--tRNA ligase subunit alpha [Candidatus Woesearchaeota archaeon]
MADTSDDLVRLLANLHPLERAVLPHLRKETTLDGLVRASSLKEVEVMRALQWLANRRAVSLAADISETVSLDSEGRRVAKEGLPERKLLLLLAKKPIPMEDLVRREELAKDERDIALGILKGKAAATIEKGEISLTDQGRRLVDKDSLEEQFLKSLAKGERKIAELSPEERYSLDALRKRKRLVRVVIRKRRVVSLTPLGRQLSLLSVEKRGSPPPPAERLTPQMLASGVWKRKVFRQFDVAINVPKRYPARRHFVNLAIDYAKRVWLDMGFEEMTGPIVQTSFWNFDALFTAQDHPVREMQDTFFVGEPEFGTLPEKEVVDAVRRSHETGTEGSAGWQYAWDPKEAKRNVLRTHTTVLSALTLAKGTVKVPGKYFALGRNYRNETMDWSHLFEFNQTEGIVIDPDANFRHLLGYLKQFFMKMGFPDARFRPGYFSYTEPSVEIDVLHPAKKIWIELGGAGIFRPEVVEPLLGKDIPVLAWGPGFDRTIMEYYGIQDIRDLYLNDLKQLREMRYWMR